MAKKKNKEIPLVDAYLTSEVLSNLKPKPGEEIKPVATNSMPSEELFIERKEYKELAYPYSNDEVPTPIDIWYNRGLYGKIDTDYNPVFVDEKYLKRLPSETGDTFALNFVVDAFTDLQNYMRIAANEGKIFTEDTKFLAMEPKRGWTSVQNRYYEHITVMYEGFAATFLDQGKNKRELTDFKDFMKLFQTYLKTVQPDFPFTRTGYITSKYCPITTTGIVIELELASHGDDQVKYDDYIGDVNFVFFTRTARLFGFWVDKNAPWRLIADLKSEVMQKYMSRYPEAPVEPPLSGSQPQLPLPCAPEWFGDLKNQKVEFKKPGREDGIGYIAELLDCNDPLRSRFKIQEVVDEIEIELIQSTDVIVPKIQYADGHNSSVDSKRTAAQIINIAAPHMSGVGTAGRGQPEASAYGRSYLSRYRWLTAPLPEVRNGQTLRETVEKYYVESSTYFTRQSGLGAFKPQPILLDASDSKINYLNENITKYNWKVLEDSDFPNQQTQFFLTPDTSGGPLSSTDGITTPTPQIYFIPVREGPHTIQLTLTDNNGDLRDEEAIVTLNLCTLDWQKTADDFILTPGIDAAEAFGPDWIYSKLKDEIAQVWTEWNQKSNEEWFKWLSSVRNEKLENIMGGTPAERQWLPYSLAASTAPTGPIFPFPYKRQSAAAIESFRAGNWSSPEIEPSIGGPNDPLCQGALLGDDQLPQTGELEFLRTRLGWDIVGKYKLLTAWIQYLMFEPSGAFVETVPRLLYPVLATHNTWKRLLIRAEIGPDIYLTSTGFNAVGLGTANCLHQFVYNQWQARNLSAPAAFGQSANHRYDFHPPPLYGNCATKIERYNLLSPTGASGGFPIKDYIFRGPSASGAARQGYQSYKVPTAVNLTSLLPREKGLNDNQMGNMFGGALADLFEIILVVSRQLLGGAPVRELTGNVNPPNFPGVPPISPEPLLEHFTFTEWFTGFAREPFSGMGVVPFAPFWQRLPSGPGIGSVDENYRSDFVIKKIDFTGALTRILNGRQWNESHIPGTLATPYELWRTRVYHIPASYARPLFVDDPRFRDAIIPSQIMPGAPSPTVVTSELDEVVRYLTSLDPSDNKPGVPTYDNMLTFVIAVASGENCGKILLPDAIPSADPPPITISLDTFETLPFDYGGSFPDEPPREKDWVLSFGDVEEYSNKREQYTQAIIDHPRLLREWELRKLAYDNWVIAYADWLTLPRLSFDNLYLHNPPVLRSPGEYVRSFETDIDLLQTYTLNFYNSYVAKHPFIVTSQFNKCGDGTLQKIETRELLSGVELMRTYDDLFWLKFYFAIRISESDRILSFSEEDAMIKQIENLYSNSLASSDSNKFTKALQRIAFETNGVFEDKSGLTVQNKDDKIINKFKNITEQKTLTLRDVYDIVLPDGSFQP